MPVLTLVLVSNPNVSCVLHTKDIESVSCIVGSRNIGCEVHTKSGQIIRTSTMFDTIADAMGWRYQLLPPLGTAVADKRRKKR